MRNATHSALLLTLTLTGCGPLSPDVQEANRYLRQLQPLLIENRQLADQVLANAAAVYNSASDEDELAKAWTTDVVPLAEHLHHQATAVQPEGAWGDRQEALTQIWGDRAQAYRALSEALIVADRSAWPAEARRAREVQLREETWFKETNAVLADLGLAAIDPTP